MDDDWQLAAFSNRHLHNRNDKTSSRSGKRAEFNVRNTFGSHLVKCPAIEALQGGTKSKSQDVVLEIYRLTDSQDGLVGSLKSAGTLDATVVFAGSRKGLGKIVRHLGDTKPRSNSFRKAGAGHMENGIDEHEEEEEEEDEQEDTDDEDGFESQSQSSEGLEPEARQRRRIATFEKNSFRQPKFWFRWQGEVQRAGDSDTDKVHGSGYVVMASNECKRFQGTITSEEMGWNNVKMTGWKTRPQPERDFEIRWKPS